MSNKLLRESSSNMKYRCKVCGQIVEVAEGESCPICGTDFSNLEPLPEEGDAKIDWACEHKIGIAKNTDDKIIAGLRDHFKGECSEVCMYLAMSRQALREGYPEVALLLEQIAKEEAEHGARFAELLGELVYDDTKKNLEKMLAGEAGACKSKQEIASRAKELGFDAIHDSVHEMARDEARHGKALQAMLDRYFK